MDVHKGDEMSNSYRDLIAWQKGMALVTEVYRATSSFPEANFEGFRIKCEGRQFQ